MQNPLFEAKSLPLFQDIQAEHALPAIKTIITENKAAIEKICQEKKPNFLNLVQPLEDLSNRLENVWSPIRHLNNVCNNESLRKIFESALTLLSEYHSEIGQNEKLFELFNTLKNDPAFSTLTLPQQKIIDDTLLDFTLAGVGLSNEKKQRYRDIQQKLAQLSNQFENNLLDATAAWFIHLLNETDLAGLPPHAIKAAREEAEKRHLTGWVFTLEYPSYSAIMNYADSRSLRESVYTAYCTRASDQGPHAEQFDNSDIMNEILALRHELALLLGFQNYTELSLATKMVKNPSIVIHFLEDLVKKAKPMAIKEIKTLEVFGQENFQLDNLEAWDISYLSEKLKQQAYNIDDEMLRPYFPENTVLSGLFSIVNQLYGIQIQEDNDIETWHPNVKAYKIYNTAHEPIAFFYLDLYARPHKRGGAWMDDCRSKHRDAQGYLQLPAAYLTCNFTKPQGNDPALLTHHEVLTLFHEFGHGLHHMLTEIESISISGINGVEWDAVELPSQFMENFCWEKKSLDLISRHYQTGETLPDDLYQKMLNAKNFLTAMMTVRQLEFSLFDFRLHLEYNPQHPQSIQSCLDKVRHAVSVVPYPNFNRFQHGFSHIFAGGYAAGYYSYKWAEILSSDAYSLFEENGIFCQETGLAFLNKLLSQGGSKPAAELFKAFRGREPSIDAYLRHNGLTQDASKC
jgi:oligopeptidase A